MKCTLCQKYFTYGVAPLWAERQRKADHMEHLCHGMVWLSSCFWWHWAAQYRQTSRDLQTLTSTTPTLTQEKMEHLCVFHHYVVHWWCSLNGSIHLSNSRVLFKQDLNAFVIPSGKNRAKWSMERQEIQTHRAKHNQCQPLDKKITWEKKILKFV